jgi:beta-glucosidase
MSFNKKIALLLASALLLFSSPPTLAEVAPKATGAWTNKALSADARAEAVVTAMTQAEKLLLVFGYFATDGAWLSSGTRRFEFPKGGLPYSAGFVPGIDRLGIPPQWQTDAGTGVASQRSPNPRMRTALASGISTASTFDRDLAYAGGAMIGNEARLSGFNVQLAGGMNLMREPRSGRNFEYTGEDPLLAGIITGNAIKGIQSNHIVSTMKHFAFNDQETNRTTIDNKIADKDGRQSDLLAFQIAFEIGDPGSVMCSYNRINGVYACENDWLLNQVLKNDWGFKGYVMSDWGATHSTIPAALAGLDQQTGWAFDLSNYFEGALREAVNNGHVSPARLHDMARRIVRPMFATGLFDDPVTGDTTTSIDFAAHAKITQAGAEEGIVLLKNVGVLPLAKSLRTIAIIGGHADKGVLSGGGSAQVYPVGGMAVPNEGPEGFPGPIVFYPSSPMKGLQSRSTAVITYHDGKDLKAAARLAASSDIAIVFATQWTAESFDVPDLNLPNKQDQLITTVADANKKTVVVLQTGGPVVMPWLPRVGAVVEAWYPGTAGGEAIARVLTGEVNPSGHLPATFPASVDQLPRPKIDGDRTQEKNRELHLHSNYDIEGAAVGYKWFDKKGLKPLFAFGHGLGYTKFSTSTLKAEAAGKGLRVSVGLKNVGAIDGKAVAQVYVAPVADAGWESPKRLGAFGKIHLKAGESKTLALSVDPRLLGTFDSASKTWKIKAGEYKIMTGNSANDITQTVKVRLENQTLNVQGK